MKTKITVVIFMLCFCMFTPSIVQAQLISFSDNSIFWPGWNNNTSDDTIDTIGAPNFIGGEATVINEQLNSLTFNRQAGSTLWGILSPGDLFIDIGADQTWNYVVDLTSWTSAGSSNSDPVAGNYNIYSLSLPLDSASGYVLSGNDRTGDWSGYWIRDGHPVALKDIPAESFGTAYFTGWGNNATTQYAFYFDELDLGPSGTFNIGWMPNCANDVIYQNLTYTVTPEPATMLLFGTGLVGFALRKRRA